VLRSRQDGADIVFDVVDHGPGIAPENRTKIFAPFFTTKAQGMGMGLAIVSRVVTRCGGTIRLVSGAGEPTTFRVRLPNARATRPASGARSERPVATA
jgi:signal transduction histidine kinase